LAAAVGAVEALHEVITPRAYSNWEVTGAARWYPHGVAVSTDLAVASIDAGDSGADPMNTPSAYQQEFTGRSADGRQVSWYYQGLDLGLTSTQREFISTSVVVASVYGGLTALVEGGLCTISGQAPVVKPYANLTVNDYLTRQARRA
jgi:hypothetical protein